MSDFNSGMSQMRKIYSIVDALADAGEALHESAADKQQFKEFKKNLQHDNPSKPVMNNKNTVFYETTGIGHQKIQKLFNDSKIPNAAFIRESDGKTVVAVPSQYSKQTNILLGAHSATQPQHATNPQEQKLLKILKENNAKGTFPSPLVTRGLKSGYVSVYAMSPGACTGMSKKLTEASIPHATVASKDGTHYIMTNSAFNPQFDIMHKQLQQSQSMLPRAEFMKQNLGENIVEHTYITEGQARALREQLQGAGLGCNLERQSTIANAQMQSMKENCPGLAGEMYTLRYNASQAKYIEPIIASTLVQCNGANRDALESNAIAIKSLAQQTSNLAAQQHSMVIVDAMNPERRFSIDKSGMRDAQGNLVTTPQSKEYQAQVYAAVYGMKQPMMKEVENPTKHRIEDVFTREEIAKAQAGWAQTQPDEAGLAAGRLASLKVTSDLSAPNAEIANICNDAALTAETLSNGIEDNTYRYSAEEIYDILNIQDVTDAEGVIKKVQETKEFKPEQKAQLEKLIKQDPDKALSYLDNLSNLPKETKKDLIKSVELMDNSASKFIAATNNMSAEAKASLTSSISFFSQYNSMHGTNIKSVGVQDLSMSDIENHFEQGETVAPDLGRTEIDAQDIGEPVLEGDI